MGYYDTNNLSRLYNRLLFPVRDPYGNLVTFQGRAMSDDMSPKYWHQPFDKDAVMYGLYEMGERAVEQGVAVLVEGPFDALAMYDAGLVGLASLGTAFGQQQAFLIRRYVKKVVIWYDPDNAGNIATGKAIPILKDVGLEVRVPALRLGGDPSEVWQKHGIDGIIKVLHESRRV